MGIFNNRFTSKKKNEVTPEKKSFVDWIPLTSLEQLETLKTASNSATVLIFKHSTRCGISSMVIKKFEKLFTEEHQSLQVYYLDLLNYRDLSNEVGYTFQVQHQSPQLLVVKSGVSVYSAAHYDILETNLTRFV